MPYTLMVQHRTTPQGAERIIFENGQPLGIAIIDMSVPDFTLGWPVSGAYRPADLLENWLSHLLPAYGVPPSPMTLEFYIGERFHQYTLRTSVSVEEINGRVRDQIGPSGTLTFLLLNAQNNVLEISLTNGVLMQCACTLSEVHLRPLINFFTAYHASWKVREDTELSKQIFSKPGQLAGGLDFLQPVPVFSEEERR